MAAPVLEWDTDFQGGGVTECDFATSSEHFPRKFFTEKRLKYGRRLTNMSGCPSPRFDLDFPKAVDVCEGSLW